MPGVVCLGELLVDFCADRPDVGLDGACTFTKAPGGAPANVAVGVVRLGESAGFVGAVGDDPFGDFLEAALRKEGVDTSFLIKTDSAHTSLAFIAARSDGRKDITFYRNPGADMCLAAEHIDAWYIGSAEVLHFGSISRIDEGPRAATDRARRLAAEAGALISYDPNYRPSLWAAPDLARKRILEGLAGTNVAKLSAEEWEFITGAEDFAQGAGLILQMGVDLVVRSEGSDGASFATAQYAGHVDGFEVDCIEPTGAGDGFCACLIVQLLRYWREGIPPRQLQVQELNRIVRRANAAGALACTKVGAIPSLPTTQEVEALMVG
jgi:fructokinase